jgi:hypothetical protein
MALNPPEIVDRTILADPVGFGTEVHIALRIIMLPILGERLVRPSRKGTENLLKTLFFDPASVNEEMIARALEIGGLPGL